MNRATGTTMKPITLVSAFKHSILATQRHAQFIDPLHGDVTFGNFCIRLFNCHHVGGQKCIAVIERKALIVSLLTNTSDYSSETTIFVRCKHINLSMQVLLE